MVFSNLQEREKDAFFSLLDEYFHSRPDIFAALSGQGNTNSSNTGNKSATANAATIGQRLFTAAPGMAAAAAASKPRFGGSGGSFSGAGTGGNATSQEQLQQLQEEAQPVAGRVAAAAAAFAQHRSTSSGSSPNLGSSTPSRIGGMDTSALKNVFAGRAGQAGPPPPSFNRTVAAAPPPPVARRQPEPEPEPEPEAQEEAQGEWARALYDYDSNEPGDLNIKENQQILVTERSSDDWWTGEVDGRSGLFPASYVELL